MKRSVGRPSFLDNKKNLLELRKEFMKSKPWAEIAEKFNIPLDTLEGWLETNFRGFNDIALAWKHERMLRKAEKNLEERLDLDTLTPATGAFGVILKDKKGNVIMKDNPALLAIKHDTDKYVSSTLGKKHYSTRREMVGAGGAPLVEAGAVKEALAGLDKNIKEKEDDSELAPEAGSEDFIE